MSDPTCPLAYRVHGQRRMVSPGYGCGATGGRCVPCAECNDRISAASNQLDQFEEMADAN